MKLGVALRCKQKHVAICRVGKENKKKRATTTALYYDDKETGLQ